MNDDEEKQPEEEEEEFHYDEPLDLDMDLDIDEEEEEEELEEAEEIGAPEVDEEPEEEMEEAPPKEPSEPIHAELEADVAVAVQEIPLHVVVEAGRLKMSLQQLLDLQPGNLLELGVTPESGVNLVVEGKVIGRGELIRVGEALGVRILEKG